MSVAAHHRAPRERPWTGLLWVSPWAIGFLAFLALPMALSFWHSLCDYPLLEPPVFVGLENYARLVHDPVFGRVLLNTAVYVLVSVPLSTVVAMALAVALHEPFPGRAICRTAVFAPAVVPVAASAMIFLWLYNGELGLVNQALDPLLGVLGARAPNWLGERPWAMVALIQMSLWGVGPAVVIYLAALRDVPRHLHEAARLDGVGPIGRFAHVTLPAIAPVVLFNVVVSLLSAWQVFAVPYIMTQGGPDRSTYFYSMYLYDAAFSYGQMGYASAMAWVQLLIVLLVTAACLRVGRR